MGQLRLLICDRDSAYVEALVAYLLSSKTDFCVSTYSKIEAFEEDKTSYDVGVLGDEFIEPAKSKDNIANILYLSGFPGDSCGDFETIYKFQDMQAFIAKIKSLGINVERNEEIRRNSGWTGIYSPIHHELHLPFALAYAKHLTRDGSVLFLDLEENSILGDLIDISQAKNLMDYLYLLEGQSDNPFDDMAYYDGITYLAPMPYFADLSQVGRDLWENFFDSVSKLEFDKVIVLFDGAISGMNYALPYVRELILLTKPGDFYKKSSRRIETYLNARAENIIINNLELAMSGKNLVDGTYRLEQLLSGNLKRFVTAAISKKAANA